jgi:hypothetical protein
MPPVYRPLDFAPLADDMSLLAPRSRSLSLTHAATLTFPSPTFTPTRLLSTLRSLTVHPRSLHPLTVHPQVHRSVKAEALLVLEAFCRADDFYSSFMCVRMASLFFRDARVANVAVQQYVTHPHAHSCYLQHQPLFVLSKMFV